MAASSDMIVRLRRMIAEKDASKYTDADLTAAIERYPLTDANGEPPVFRDGTIVTVNTLWTATYDLNLAASEIWSEKAAALADNYNFSADGGTFNLSEVLQHYEAQARKYRARRSPKLVVLNPYPPTRNRIPWDSDVSN